LHKKIQSKSCYRKLEATHTGASTQGDGYWYYRFTADVQFAVIKVKFSHTYWSAHIQAQPFLPRH